MVYWMNYPQKIPLHKTSVFGASEALLNVTNKYIRAFYHYLSPESNQVLGMHAHDFYEINIVLKKSLTDREQLVFEYFLNNVGKTVFAKDLAELLELPRDYVYKYIKNLRAKIEGDKLKNAPTGGFILTE